MPDGPLRILMIDDDDLPPEALVRAFRAKRRTVDLQTASDGAAALARLRGTKSQPPLPPPYVVLLDLNMPGMSGLDVLDELRADPYLAGTVVFILSTSDDPRDVEAAYARNVAGYLIKQRLSGDYGRLVDLLDRYWQAVRLPSGVGRRRDDPPR